MTEYISPENLQRALLRVKDKVETADADEVIARNAAIVAAVQAESEARTAEIASAVATEAQAREAAVAARYKLPAGGVPKPDLAGTVQASLEKADSAYQKPAAGIPKTDLVSSVQTSLGKADTAYQKAGTGIPKSDLASDVQTSLGKADSALQSHQSLAAYATTASVDEKVSAERTYADTTFETKAHASQTFATKAEVNPAIEDFYRKTWYGVAQTSITIKSGLSVLIGTTQYTLASDVTLQASSLGDGASRAGKDFYIYAVVNSGNLGFVLSANSTVPSGYTAENSRKIGGFHCLCLSVGSVTWKHPTLKTDVAHALSGYATGDILPASVWDLHHRPKVQPEGYAYIEECDVWMSIYLLSWSGTRCVSIYKGTVADGSSNPTWHGEKFEEDMRLQKGRLPWRSEFQIAAKGSNEQTAVTGANDKGVTGGWTATNGQRMISNYGLEDCCGFMWQWLEDLGFAGGSGWTDSVYSNSVDPRSYGQSYGNLYRLLAGGYWDDGSSCGSRASACSGVSASVGASRGGRGASEPVRRNALSGH